MIQPLTLSCGAWSTILRTRQRLFCRPEEIASRERKRTLASVPWSCGVVGSTMTIYLSGFHVPLSYTGLSLASTMLSGDGQLAPQVKAISLAVLQISELLGAVWLVHSSIRPLGTGLVLTTFNHLLGGRRGWFLATGIALSSVLLSTLARSGTLVATHRYDPALADLLKGGDLSLVATVTVYCGITPLLEEFMYRGFLLTSLATYISLPCAVASSSLIFALAHFKSPGETVGLFVVSCILGSAYAKTGDLGASLGMHSAYNLVILVFTLVW